MSNRKLKRNVVFTSQECYNVYQISIIKWYMARNDVDEFDATAWYINSGLAESFEKHHKPNGSESEISVCDLGQNIGEK